MTRRAAAAALAAVLVTGACTSSGGSPAPSTHVRTVITTLTRSPSTPSTSLSSSPASSAPPFTPAPTVHPLPPGVDPRSGERAGTCPYLKAGLDSEPTDGPNVADIEGDRVGRVTVLNRLTPVGCRFYFFAPPYGPTADIVPRTYASAAAASTALQSIVQHGTQAEPEPGFASDADGVRFRTRFFGPDGGRDWAFAFAKGRVLVIVHTRQTNVSLNAQQLATAVVGRF